MPLDLGHRPGQSREDLVETSANAQAVALLDTWPEWPVTTILAGPTGSGKTHIAGIWREMSGAHIADPAGITDADIAAVSKGSILLDDIEPDGVDQPGLFHLINAAQQAQSHLLLVSRGFPASWSVALPDLASRLKAAAIVEIGEPDDALLHGVLTKLFADRQVEVEPHVIQFLVRRMERSLATAVRLVGELDRVALEEKSAITRGLADRVIGAHGGARSLFD